MKKKTRKKIALLSHRLPNEKSRRLVVGKESRNAQIS